MRAEILSIGQEILSGFTINTNAAFLSRELEERGHDVDCHTVVPDEKRAIQQALKEALKRASLVIVTGGLGPTLDDITLDAVQPLFRAKPLSLKNVVGTAPGAFFSSKEKGIFLLPGVPREMERMFHEQVLPILTQKFPGKREYLYRFSLCLLREVEVDAFLRDLQEEHPEIECGIYPAQGTLQILLRSPEPLDAIGEAFEKKFPTYVYKEKKIEEALHHALIAHKKTLSLAESCTGGAIAARLTTIPDASSYLLGSVVAYANSWKERFLHVSHENLIQYGAVSAQVVEEMLKGLFAETGADYAIAVSGIAGPKGGTQEKPVGTIYIGTAKRGERSDIGKILAPQDRLSAIDLCVQTSLGALWRRLVHNKLTFS